VVRQVDAYYQAHPAEIKRPVVDAIFQAVVLVLLAAVGCANMTPRQQRALSGGAMGAAGGALIGAVVGGSPTIGAAVGGAVGTAAGALWEDINRTLSGGPRKQ